jgi:hypothetical protein
MRPCRDLSPPVMPHGVVSDAGADHTPRATASKWVLPMAAIFVPKCIGNRDTTLRHITARFSRQQRDDSGMSSIGQAVLHRFLGSCTRDGRHSQVHLSFKACYVRGAECVSAYVLAVGALWYRKIGTAFVLGAISNLTFAMLRLASLQSMGMALRPRRRFRVDGSTMRQGTPCDEVTPAVAPKVSPESTDGRDGV